MKNLQDGLGTQNISELALKEIYGIYKAKDLTKEQIKKCKMTERDIFQKYDNLSESEINTKKTPKNFMLKMTLWLLFLNASEAKKKYVKEK